MIFNPRVSLIETPRIGDLGTIVRAIELTEDGLVIVVGSSDWSVTARFDSHWGLRVLDEGDLGEFWSECNLTHGWCFEVFEGGWNDLEKYRGHYATGKIRRPREFLFVGRDECASVLAPAGPVLTELSTAGELDRRTL